MASLADVFVQVRPDTDKFEPDLRKKLDRVDARKSGDAVGRSFGSGLLGTVGRTVGLIGGLFAGAQVVGLFGDAIGEAREAAQVTRITENAIRATGGAAKVSAADVGALATAISNKTGIDDEAVQSASNLLLTFKNVRNEAGEGARIFDRATAAAMDLSAAGFGSAEGASKMLGKALNDPIKGIAALGRAGVTFTAEQKEQIKALVETGDVLSAQKIIMQEVESQVGGAAEAAADPMQRLSTIAANAKESIGTALLPYIERAATWLGENLPGAIESAVGWFEGSLVPAVQTAAGWFTENLLPPLQSFGDFITGTVVPAIRELADWIGRNSAVILPLVAGLAAGVVVFQTIVAVTRVWTAVQAALNVVMALNPIGLVVMAIAALVAGIVVAYQRSETFRNVVQGVWRAVGDAVRTVVDWWTNTAMPAIQRFWDNLTGGFTRVKDSIVAAWDGIKDGAGAAWSWIDERVIEPFRRGVERIKGFLDGIKDAWSGVKGAFGAFFDGGGGGGGAAGGGKGGAAFPLPRGTYRVGGGLNSYPGHTGQDFPVPTGTPVYAAISGLARSIDLGGRSYGKYVRIAGANGLESISAHLSGAIANGFVRAGQLIGFSGSSGNSTGPHLHQEFRQDGRVLDPRRYLMFDRGGWLMPGTTVAVNKTGRPERVLTADQEEALSRPSVSYTIVAPPAEMLAELRAAQRLDALRYRTVG